MLAAPDQQVSFTDPDSHSMATSGRGSGMVGYNVQAVVDTTNHLIVAHEVTNVGTDKSLLRTWPTRRRQHWRQKASKPSPIAVTSRARRSSPAMRLASQSRCQNPRHRRRSRKAASSPASNASIQKSMLLLCPNVLRKGPHLFLCPLRRPIFGNKVALELRE